MTQWLVEEAVFVAADVRDGLSDEDRAMRTLIDRHAELSALRDRTV